MRTFVDCRPSRLLATKHPADSAHVFWKCGIPDRFANSLPTNSHPKSSSKSLELCERADNEPVAEPAAAADSLALAAEPQIVRRRIGSVTAVWFLVPAVVNGGLTTVAFLASRRSALAGVLVSVAVTSIYVGVLWFWPGPPSRQPGGDLFWTYVAIVGVTWFPRAVMAVVGGRRHRRLRGPLGIGAVCLGVLLGAGYILTALAFACRFLGDCL